MSGPYLLCFGSAGGLKIFEQKDDRLNYLINDEGACGTALATPGLLISPKKSGFFYVSKIM